jgi:hypothetical protein
MMQRWGRGLLAALLCGCGGEEPATNPAVVRFDGTAAGWMAPSAQQQDLLYVSLADPNEHVVLVYSYRSQALLGTLTGFDEPQALCVDASQDLFVTDNTRHQISKFRHGGSKRIKVLVDPVGAPLGCAVDPSSGDLAIANFTSREGDGNVAIYRRAKGIPKTYVSDAISYYWFPAYDDAGDLFVDGLNEQGTSVALAELPAGAHRFHTVTLDQEIAYPGGIYWDGRYLAMGDQRAGAVYEFAISNFTARLEKTTNVSAADDLFEFWISPNDRTLVGAAYGDGYGNNSAVYYWKYPRGGSPRHTIAGVPYASGLVVSLAKPAPSRGRR